MRARFALQSPPSQDDNSKRFTMTCGLEATFERRMSEHHFTSIDRTHEDDPALAGLRTRMDDMMHARTERMIRQRRRLHATPEPAGSEFATTEFVVEQLREAGLQPRVMPERTGIVVDVDLGARHNTFVAIRAELDCVRVNDDKQVPYASTRPGLCHACGHDVHATIAMNTGQVLHELRPQIAALKPMHNVRLVFQPAEETAIGARQMIQHGAIDHVECILAMHVEPFTPAGRVGLRRGALTVACKLFTFHLRGRGGHSARPFEAIDPILAATSLVDQLYQYCPRVVDARHPTVLTIGSIHAGSAPNAIPDDAVVAGTLRTLREDDLRLIQQRMEEIRAAVAQASGCDIELSFGSYCPATNNDARLVDLVEHSARQAFGHDAVQWIDLPSMGGEDFAFYQELIPGAIIRLGAALRDERKRRPLHSSLFDVDETALTVGGRLMARWALDAAMTFEPGVA
jgi:amidohydrolase